MAEDGRRLVGIDEFIEGLRSVPGFASEGVWKQLATRKVDTDSLDSYVFFSPASYTRNLIYKNDDFELLAICWEIGQASRVHNHRDQRCWMLLPQGQLRCQNYAVHDRDPEQQTCRLEASRNFLLGPDSPAEVEAEEPVHQVLNLGEFGERAVSLHIYAKPFNTCEIYQLDRGTYCDVELTYTSVFGKLCAGETTARREPAR